MEKNPKNRYVTFYGYVLAGISLSGTNSSMHWYVLFLVHFMEEMCTLWYHFQHLPKQESTEVQKSETFESLAICEVRGENYTCLAALRFNFKACRAPSPRSAVRTLER